MVVGIMAREFTKNMFVMLFSIMIGAIIITYFVGDIIYRSDIETLAVQHTTEIESLEEMNINFTSHFLSSSVLLDESREDRAFGNYHFDLAFLWLKSALVEENSSTLDVYKNRTIDNCTYAMEKYLISHQNFKEAKIFFNDTKAYTSYEKYLEILDLYVSLTASGARLTMLRYNASKYLKYMAENLSLDMNISALFELFNETMDLYEEELDIYEDYQDEIDEYEFFEEIR
jgi:hypothetical protein